MLIFVVGVPTDGSAQAVGDALAQNDGGGSVTDARGAADNLDVTGKLYGGKSSAMDIVKRQQAPRREAANAVPKTGDWFEDWIKGPSVLGDWGGYRQKAEDLGFTFSGFSATDLLTNTSGGQRKSFAAANSTLMALDIDFEKLVGLPGFLIHSEGWWAGGNNLSGASRIDNLFNVATAYTPNGYYLGQLYAQQELFDKQLRLQAGRMTTANNFASLPISANYVSVATNGIPVSLPVNTLPFTAPPATQWGSVATVTPIPQIQLTAGVYAANRRSSELNGTNGVDFGLNLSRGVMPVGQVTYLHEQNKGDTGLPGTYYLGGFYASDKYDRIDGGPQKDGNYGFYVMGQQMAYREGGPGSSEGLTPWLAVTYQPEESINLLPVFVAGGASYEGLIPGRDTDTTAVAVYYGKLSKDVQDTTGETVLEVNYTFWATPWLGLTPDFQYVFNPSGGSSNNDAAVFGGQINLIF
jgi:porin